MTNSPRPPLAEPSRFAVPLGDLDAMQVTQAQMTESVTHSHPMMPSHAQALWGDVDGADGDG